MKFGLLYELEMPRPWTEASERETWQQAIEQVIAAEQVGFEYVWVVEHHFLEEFSHSSAPEVFFGALSQKTSKIRLGHGVVLLPYPFNHPIRVAERVAALDIVSGGRVEFGTGRGLSSLELEGFGIDPNESRAMWEEALSIIPRMWSEDPFSYKGRFFDIPPRNVVPKPVQKPHPPIWMAATQPESFQYAARKGVGVLCFTLSEPGDLAQRIQDYRRDIKAAEPVGGFTNEQVGAFTIVHCQEDNDEARRLGGEGALWYMNKIQDMFLGIWRGTAAKDYSYYSYQVERQKELAPQMTPDLLIDSGTVCVGDPERCARTIKMYESLGIDQLLCLVQAGRIPHDKILKTIRLFGEHIIPRFSGAGE